MLEKLLPKIVMLAVSAGHAVMEVYADSTDIVAIKTDNSPLTHADLASDLIIREGLQELGLGWPLLSEESAQLDFIERQAWQRFWLIDPLDGTKEFIKRNGEFTVNIALIENGVPILGVVYAPALKTCYYGASGVGAFVKRGDLNPQPIVVASYDVNEIMRVVISRSHCNSRTQKLLDQMGEYECIRIGSSLKMCLVAEGAAHFYPRLGQTMEWDTAAAHAVVCAAGGCVQDREGLQLRYNKSDLRNLDFFVFSSRNKTLSKVINNFNS
ncbi:3'(2'),5'-bisphosphate nucleotidase CysQ [Herminiimonas arsenitoxidans]|uniref:3'(2'),5'-bisphosphate nucleotidase CysQ n=1 Tax=Herminiimonas arsenitoxidans TaxID=1809410 RepID=UPI000970A62A|nr:3'(2'),5'-bisphosphate nucleotidase CysQ [Herminiimonas arsenitoxidans]